MKKILNISVIIAIFLFILNINAFSGPILIQGAMDVEVVNLVSVLERGKGVRS